MPYSDYPSPPTSEVENMDRSQRLPPITTQLAGYFQHRPSTPPISPQDDRQTESSALKRKRSDEKVPTDEALHRGAKRPAMEEADRSNTSYVAGSQHLETSAPMSNLLRAPSPATYADHRSPLRHGVQYESRQGQTHSPHSHSGHSYKGSAPEHYRSPSTHGDPRPSSSAIPSTGSTIYDRLPPQPAGRALPPLITPQSPRSGVTSSIEGSFDTSSLPQPRQTLPPLEPPSAYAPPASRYTYPTDNGAMPRYPAPNTDSSSYAYASPRPNPLPSQSSYPAEPTRSSYSFDPIRGAPSYQSPGQRLALPSMLSLGDPLAAAPIAQPPPLNGAPPAYTPDRYRFNAQPQTDHPARRRRGNLPKEATSRLNDWFAAHAAYPYPKEEEKQRLQEETGLSMSQIGNWFINARRRRKPIPGRPMDSLPPPPPGRHTYATQTMPQMPPPLPPPGSGYNRDYARLPPPYP